MSWVDRETVRAGKMYREEYVRGGNVLGKCPTLGTVNLTPSFIAGCCHLANLMA